MHKMIKIVVMTVAAALVSSAAKAQVNPDDLVLGFTSTANDVASDYILDLGQIPTTPNTQLSGVSLAAFNSIFGAADIANGNVDVGIVGGNTANPDVTVSVARTGSAPNNLPANFTVKGAEAKPAFFTTSANTSFAAQDVEALSLGVVSHSSPTSWYQSISQYGVGPENQPNGSLGSYAPASTESLSVLPATEQITLDLFNENDAASGVFVYQGDVQLDLSGSTLSAVFDPVATPEPSTLALLGAAAVLGLAFRRQLVRKTA
jgi:hypothetical protein